jgi:FtsP/CotA-like multicopper oxidase with cupredoxin domain
MTKSIQKDIGQGAPAGLGDLAKDSKFVRLELTLGEAVAADVTIQTADEEAGKRVADAVSGMGDFIRAQVAQMKQAFAQVPPQAAAQMAPLREMADAMMSLADAFKPEQSGTKVTMKADAKAAGAMLLVVGRGLKMEAQNAPAGKGGL